MPAVLGAFIAALAVILGAFGAHTLKPVLSGSELETYHTAVYYLLMHGIAMVLTRFSPSLTKAGWLFLTGIILFSGSLFLIVLTGIRLFGIITPFGGVLFILGWITFGVQLYREYRNAS